MDDREAGRYGRPDHVARPSRPAQPEEKDDEIARLRKELKEKDDEIDRLKDQVAELEGQQGNPNFLDLGKAGGPLLPFDPLNP